jgi:hypothetical protein
MAVQETLELIAALQLPCTDIEVLDQLQRLDGSPLSAKIQPDRILAPRVLRKRSHPYKAQTIPDPTADERRGHSERMKRLLSR